MIKLIDIFPQKKREYNRENFLILIEIKNIYTHKAIMT